MLHCRVGVQAQAGSQGLEGAYGLPLLFLCVNQPLFFCQASCLHLDIFVILLSHSAWPEARLAGSLLGSVHHCGQPAGARWGWGRLSRASLQASQLPKAANQALASPNYLPIVH